MRVLLLGGAGFIGQNLSHFLARRGISVISYGRHESTKVETEINISHIIGARDDNRRLKEAMRDCEIIFDLAHSATPASSSHDGLNQALKHASDVNRSIQSAIEMNIHKYIYLSSGGAIYGSHTNGPCKENAPLRPVSHYGYAKLLAEKTCEFMGRIQNTTRVLIVRPSNPYGPMFPSKKRQGAINIFLRKAFAGETVELWGDPTLICKDYIYIDDLCDHLWKTMQYVGGHNCFNAGSGAAYSLRQIIDIIEQELGLPLATKLQPSYSGDVQSFYLDTTLSDLELGFKASTPLGSGIKQTIFWEASRQEV